MTMAEDMNRRKRYSDLVEKYLIRLFFTFFPKMPIIETEYVHILVEACGISGM